MKTKKLAMTVAFCALSASSMSQAQSPASQTLYTRGLAATCANCHGTDGKSVQGSSVAPLAGMDRAYLSAQLKAFKSGARPATVMHQISKGYSDAQIETLAEYFAAQKK